ncbi:helix-turn-helix domain-containing protein [Anaerovorax odorimutans]|uniref:Helix-turn-helix domain-containing protein n=1 Tax=Anaerovorax odorimutans TaxID=109327 RepID=A0ABT1RT68_9FIRM|nr:helix-turn-helix transcriptional regulator [Anaerovorax odorimutans]MCQ4638319.1 helix-turn-helix domain-containing protein [Anaerovorax odorimutans]
MRIDDHLRLSRNLQILRRTVRLSQTELATKIGLCRSSYSQLEQGERLPDLHTLYLLSQFYHVAMDVLVKCDVQSVLSDYFLHQNLSKNERQLLKLYSRLSEVSKGQLLERAEELARLDILRRKETLQVDY